MQAVCEPELLAGLLRELSAEALPVFGDERVRAQVRDLTANDGTLLPALPRMAWALWQDERNRAGKLHLEFSVWRQVPSEFTVTPGNDSERAAWEAKLKPGSFYVNDRHYGHDYKLIGRVLKAKASLVLRLFNNTVLDRLEPARGLTPADRQAAGLEDHLHVFLVHADRAGQHAGSDVADAGHLQQALYRAVLAERAVQDREHHVDLAEQARDLAGR